MLQVYIACFMLKLGSNAVRTCLGINQVAADWNFLKHLYLLQAVYGLQYLKKVQIVSSTLTPPSYFILFTLSRCRKFGFALVSVRQSLSANLSTSVVTDINGPLILYVNASMSFCYSVSMSCAGALVLCGCKLRRNPLRYPCPQSQTDPLFQDLGSASHETRPLAGTSILRRF